MFFWLEGKNLYVTNQSDTHYKLVTNNYTLGTRFEAKFVTGRGQIKAYYNGALQATMSISSSTASFKAGAYPQGNCDNASPCSSSNYGEVIIYDISVTG